ncbi:hypothetical protein L208DRAFT_1085957, partial [Tricholoma matsutake]
KAFWPAWAQLDELKALLPCSIPWQAISATYPQHILKTVESKILRPNYVSIYTSCNHPNTMYAMHCVPTRIEDCKNYECFLLQLFEPAYQPHILIFFDDTDLATAVSNHLDSLLLIPYRAKGIIQHYHSRMSEQYLCEAHSAFTQDNGICKILCVTSGQSVGVDFLDMKIVCNAGLPNNVVDVLQRGGRVGHRNGSQGLFVIFYDPWALLISLTEFDHAVSHDPDRLCTLAKPTTSRRDHAPRSCIDLVQCETCLRAFFVTYLGDNAEN